MGRATKWREKMGKRKGTQKEEMQKKVNSKREKNREIGTHFLYNEK